MKIPGIAWWSWISSLTAWICMAGLSAEEARFHWGINLNGPALRLDGRVWEGGDTTNLVVTGNKFENQTVSLKPATDPVRARMIRSSRWGSRVEVEFKAVPPGQYQAFLYVWEDNHTEQFDLLVNGKVVHEKFHIGTAGQWRRLGPWRADSDSGSIRISARGPGHGAANLSGVEIWSGDGPVPDPRPPEFALVPSGEQLEFFEKRIRPVLVDHCYECHRAGAKKVGGGLLLDSRAGMMRGGDSGPVETPGEPEASLLINAVRHVDANLSMPPDGKLGDLEIADLERWIAMGAPDPRNEDTVAKVAAQGRIDWDQARSWWSFRPFKEPAVPSVERRDWPRGDLDRFILASLETAGLEPAPDADRRVLIRRASYDLTGLPPTPEAVEAFEADRSPDAFARVVDGLLASPRYGERWGRHWLDVVRYADTAGDNSDFPIPQMHRYRDWVIDAFNRDLPYGEFVRDQIAGDLHPGGSLEETLGRVVATGYLANARRFGSRVDDYPQHLTIEDTVDNLGRAFLGLTVGCARCHDHKFDPIPTTDYYGLYGIFHNTRYPWPGIELDQKQRDLVPLVAVEKLGEVAAARKARDDAQRQHEKEIKRLRDVLKEKSGEDKKSVEAQIREAEKAAKEQASQPFPYELAYAVAETGKSEDVTVQLKGDPAKPGEKVGRRFLTVLGGMKVVGDAGSGRAQLAGWIAAPDNPLTWRVMVNRIWLHHFGKGLVPTPNDFGRQGKPPTHPELLDWLTTRFVAEGGSMKAMHRLILLSRTYQLSGERSEMAVEKDPGNGLLGSFPRRRLDAETIRDTLLLLAGNLEEARPGAHPFPPPTEWKFTQHNPFKAVYESRHRSIYLMTQRIQRHPYLAIFDGADPAASTPVRTSSTTPLQALWLMNDAFVHDQAKGFSERLTRHCGMTGDRWDRAYREALGRAPTSAEREGMEQFVAAMRTRLRDGGMEEGHIEGETAAALARVIFRLNELIYVD